jgi:hypothetical protein
MKSRLEAGGMLDHAPRPRKTAGHFLGLHAALYEPNYCVGNTDVIISVLSS